jgi:HEAT repeat protein
VKFVDKMPLDLIFQSYLHNLTDPDPAIRAAALDAIGQWGAENADDLPFQALAQVVFTLADPDRDVRWAAAYAVGAIGEPSVTPVLLASLDAAYADGDTGLTLVIVKALGKLASPDALSTLRELAESAATECVRVAARRSIARVDEME